MLNLNGPAMIGNIIQITIRVWNLVVDRGRHHAILDGFDRDNGLYSSGSAKQVPGHRFRRGDWNLVSQLAEYCFYSCSFAFIIQGCAGAVSVNITDLPNAQSSVLYEPSAYSELLQNRFPPVRKYGRRHS